MLPGVYNLVHIKVETRHVKHLANPWHLPSIKQGYYKVEVFIWESLAQLLPPGSLHEIKLHETDKNVVYFKGEYA